MNDTDAVLQLEARRCDAICSGDVPALREILSDDYVHVHAMGNIDNREGFIAGVLSNPRIVQRRNIVVRFYGDVAILIGEQVNRKGDSATTSTMQQVATRHDESWIFVSAQVTRRG